MFKSSKFIGCGVRSINGKVAIPVKTAPFRNYATPEQVAAYRNTLIKQGIIKLVA